MASLDYNGYRYAVMDKGDEIATFGDDDSYAKKVLQEKKVR